MILSAIIWNLKTIYLVEWIIFVCVFSIYVACKYFDYGMGKNDDDDDVPDEITLEVVKEKPKIPEKPSASQNAPSVQPGSAVVYPDSYDSSRPTEKEVSASD